MSNEPTSSEEQSMTEDIVTTPDRRVALITGATGGLGRVLSADLAAAGWDLALIGSNADRLDALKTELGLPAGRVLGVAVDLREADVAIDAIEAVYQHFGRVDALAHLVGGWTGGTRVDRRHG